MSVESVISDDLTRGKLYYEKCDTGDLESVRNFAKKVQENFPAIHLLINNGEWWNLTRKLIYKI